MFVTSLEKNHVLKTVIQKAYLSSDIWR